MGKLVEIELDQKSAREVQKGMFRYGEDVAKGIKRVLWTMGLTAESIAKLRLSGTLGSAAHIVTGRLRASVHAEEKGRKTNETVADSKAADANLNESLSDMEVIVGTNVEYAPKIEFDYDSFIRFAGENIEPKLVKEGIKELDKITKKANS